MCQVVQPAAGGSQQMVRCRDGRVVGQLLMLRIATTDNHADSYVLLTAPVDHDRPPTQHTDMRLYDPHISSSEV